jgi:hypothetical protein
MIDSQFVSSISSSIFRNKNTRVIVIKQKIDCCVYILCMYMVYLLTSVLPSLLTFFVLWVMLLFTSFTSSNYCLSSKNISIISRKSGEFNCAIERRWKNAIDDNLELLLNDHKGGLITDTQFAVKCGRALKTKLVKWLWFLFSRGTESTRVRVRPCGEISEG